MSALTFAIEHRADMYQLEEGLTRELGIFMVRALELPNGQAFGFRHHIFAHQGELEAIKIPMPATLAQRIARFCARYYVMGKRGFDCKTFVGYTQGWTGIGATGFRVRTAEENVDPAEFEPFVPYAIMRGESCPHMMLGVLSEFNLSVLGPHQPLALTRTSDIMAFYRGENIRRVVRMEQIRQPSRR